MKIENTEDIHKKTILTTSFQHSAFAAINQSKKPSYSSLGTEDYVPTVILQNFECDIKQGEAIGVVGANGCGKTTTFNILAGLLSFFGEINLNESKIQEFNNSNLLREEIGVLIGGDSLPNLTFLEYCNLYLSYDNLPELYSNTDKTTFIEERFEYLVNYFKLTANFFSLNLSQMSKGMKQKVSLIANLLIPKQIYLLDEPTVGLDSLSVRKVVQLIKELTNRKMTLLISSHSVSDLIQTCDKLLFLKNGVLSQQLNLNFIRKNLISFSGKIIFNIENNTSYSSEEEVAFISILQKYLKNILACVDKNGKELFSIFFFNQGNDSCVLNLNILFPKELADVSVMEKLNVLIEDLNQKQILPTKFDRFVKLEINMPDQDLFIEIIDRMMSGLLDEFLEVISKFQSVKNEQEIKEKIEIEANNDIIYNNLLFESFEEE